jgi:hypothetical protein
MYISSDPDGAGEAEHSSYIIFEENQKRRTEYKCIEKCKWKCPCKTEIHSKIHSIIQKRRLSVKYDSICQVPGYSNWKYSNEVDNYNSRLLHPGFLEVEWEPELKCSGDMVQ